MIAVLGGLGAAASWALATLCSSRASRALPASTVVAGVMLVGLVVVLPAVAFSGVPDGLDAHSAAWLAISGIGNVVGLGLVYRGLRHGKIAVVGALASTEGAVAAILAVATGEHLGVATAAVLVVLVAAVVVVGLGETTDDLGARDASTRIATTCGIGAALVFGVSLFAAGKAASDLPAVWVVLPARLVGTVFVAAPLAWRGRLRFARPTIPFVVIAGVAEVAGTLSYATGARHSIAVTAVLGAEFAALAAVAAYFWFNERLNKRQFVGVGAIAVSVAIISALRA